MQTEWNAGQVYVDRDHQRTRQDLGDPSQFLATFYDEGKQYYVIGGQCSNYCPVCRPNTMYLNRVGPTC